jgi:hypothetical protein
MSMTADYSYLTALKIVHSMNCSMSASGQKRTSGRPQTNAATRGRITLISVNSPTVAWPRN